MTQAGFLEAQSEKTNNEEAPDFIGPSQLLIVLYNDAVDLCLPVRLSVYESITTLK